MAVKVIRLTTDLSFDNTGTGGDGVSAVVSQVEGVTVSGLNNVFAAAGDSGFDIYAGQLLCSTPISYK